jgi:hypothetical protein
MKRILILLVLLVCLPAVAQRTVEEWPNIGALKGRAVGSINKSVYVRGYFTDDDGGGGLFTITNTAIGVDNVFRIGSTNNSAWSYDRQFSGPFDLRWGGAKGDGTPGDNALITATIAAGIAKGYAIYVSNLRGVSNSLQFVQAIVPPTLKANQKYLQVGTLNGLSIYTDVSSNFVYSINGLAYHMPTIQGVPGSVFYNDGAGNITWQPVGNTFNFGDQFNVSGTNITLNSSSLSLTNIIVSGSTTTPAIELGAVCGTANFDPSASSEFNLLLTCDTVLTATNSWQDFHNVNITMTNAGNFTLTISTPAYDQYWYPSGTSTQVTNDWGIGVVNRFALWKTGGRILGSQKEGLSVDTLNKEVYSGNYGGLLPVDVPVVSAALNYDLDSPGVLYFWNGVTWY